MTYQVQPRVLLAGELDHKYPRVSLMLYRNNRLRRVEGQIVGRNIYGRYDVRLDGESGIAEDTRALAFDKLTVLP